MVNPTPNPYVGPRAFEEKDSANFFGRTEETRQLASLVIARRAVVLHSPSGAGKTSLLQASLIPRLKQRKKVVVLPISRVGGDLLPGTDRAQVKNIYVFNTLLNMLGQDAEPGDLVGLTLRQGLQTYFDAPVQADERRIRPRLLILDQFEELFTTHPDRYRERADFFLQLQHCLADYPQLSLLFAMREDYIAHLDFYAAQLPDRLRTRFRMERLRYKAALPAVKEPAARADRPFAKGVAEDLVDNLRRIQLGRSREGIPAAQSALGTYVEPVHLQIVCRQLWANLPPDRTAILTEDVQEFGDVDQALIGFYKDTLQKVMAQADISQRRLRTWFDTRLITSARTRGLVYRGEEETEGLPNAAVDILYEAYIIRADIRGGDTWYELAHDRLVEPILEANRAWQEKHQNPLTIAAETWLASGKDPEKLYAGDQLKDAQTQLETTPDELTELEKEFIIASQEAARLQAAKRQRLVLLAAVGLLILFTILSAWALFSANRAAIALGYANHQRATAEVASTVAIEQKGTAEAASTAAIQQKATAEVASTAAIEQQERAERERLRAVALGRILHANQLAAHAQAALAQDEGLSGLDRTGSLPLILAREAVLTTWITDTEVITQPFVTVEADAALRQAVDKAPPWRMTLPRHRHTAPVRSAVFSPDGKTIVTASDDETARLWDVATGQQIHYFAGHAARLNSAAFSPDGKTIVTASRDETVRLWDVVTGEEIRRFTGHTAPVKSAVFSPDGKTILSASDDKTARLWDVVSGEEIRRFIGHTAPVRSATFGPNGKTIVTASTDKTARLWDVITGKEIQRFTGHPAPLSSAAFSPDGQTIVTADSDGIARLWDLTTEQAIRSFKGHTAPLNSVAFSPDGKTIFTASDDCSARLWDVATGEEIRRFEGRDWGINSGAFSPDGQTIVVAADSYTVFGDNTAWLWDVTTGQQISWLEGHLDHILSAAFSPDGRMIVSAGRDQTARLWDVATGREIRRFEGHRAQLSSVAFSPNGQTIATAGDDRIVRLWDVTTEQEIRQFEGHTAWINSAIFSPDGKTLLTASSDRTARLWDVATGQEIRRFEGHTDALNSAAFSPNGEMIMTTSSDQTVRLWDLATRQEIQRFEGNWAAFSPDGQTLITTSEDKPIRLWDVATGQEVDRFDKDSASITRPVFSPDGRMVVTARGTVAQLWDVTTGQLIELLEGHLVVTEGINSVAFSPDGRTIVTASGSSGPSGARGTLRLWNVVLGDRNQRLEGYEGDVNSVAFSPDGKTLITASSDRTARLWDVATGQEIRRFEGHTDEVNSVAFSPDGRTIVTTSGSRYGEDKDLTARLWDVATGQEIRRFEGHADAVNSAVFSPDGETIVTTSSDWTARLWDVATGQEIRRFEGHADQVNSAAFSPDGQTVVTASGKRRFLTTVTDSSGNRTERWVFSEDNTVRLWDVATGQEIRRFEGHIERVNSVLFSPDGQTIVTASDDNTIRLWNVDTGQEIRRFKGHAGGVNSVAFSSNGRAIVTASGDGTARLWDVATGQEIRRLEGSNSAAFSPDGQTIVTVSWREVHLWPSIENLLKSAEALIQREPPILTGEERLRFGLEW